MDIAGPISKKCPLTREAGESPLSVRLIGCPGAGTEARVNYRFESGRADDRPLPGDTIGAELTYHLPANHLIAQMSEVRPAPDVTSHWVRIPAIVTGCSG